VLIRLESKRGQHRYYSSPKTVSICSNVVVSPRLECGPALGVTGRTEDLEFGALAPNHGNFPGKGVSLFCKSNKYLLAIRIKIPGAVQIARQSRHPKTTGRQASRCTQ
jgi:hypothetical protein